MEFLAFQSPIIQTSFLHHQGREHLVLEYGVDKSRTDPKTIFEEAPDSSASSIFLSGIGGGVVDTWDLRYKPSLPQNVQGQESISSGGLNIFSSNPESSLLSCSKEIKLEISTKVEKETRRARVLKPEDLTNHDIVEQKTIDKEFECAMVDLKMAEKEFAEIMEKDVEINEKGM